MADQQGEESTNDAVQAGIDLRWKNHLLQGHSIAMTRRYDDTIAKVETRSDREARKVMQGLAKELNGLNGTLAEYLARLSNANHGLAEMLQKSEDGRAAVMMRRAAEMLVKGLASAEEEVQSLKVALEEVKGQRDKYKALLAKTNSELKSNQAYAQMSKATGQTTAPALEECEDAADTQPPAKRRRKASERGKAAAELPQPSRGGAGSSSSGARSTGITFGSSSITDNGNGSTNQGSGSSEPAKGKGRATARPARIGKPSTAEWSQDKRSRAKDSDSTSMTPPSIEATVSRETRAVRGAPAASSATSTRRRGQAETSANDAEQERVGRPGGALRGKGLPARERKNVQAEEVGTKDRGVEVPVSQEGAEQWEASLRDGGGGDGGGGHGDVESVYDSDDAPSMFF